MRRTVPDKERAEHVCRTIANFARVVLARSKNESKWEAKRALTFIRLLGNASQEMVA